MNFLNPSLKSAALLALASASAFPQAITETRTETTTTDIAVITTDKPVIEPTRAASTTPYATTGLSNVISAEQIGAGRINLSLRGNFYKQDRTFVGAPPSGSQITTATGAVGFGLNDYLDAFAALNIYNLRQSDGDGSGFGSSIIGAQVGIPFASGVPIRVGAQAAAIFGTADNQINTNTLDGYNYLETRTGNDFMVRLTQSMLFVKDQTGFKIHLNEGVISSLQDGKDIALLTGAGVEVIPIVSLILGLEANSRTFLSAVDSKDPLWVTPSITWRTPAFVNLNVGADIALSGDRDGTTVRALEPWRLFGGLTYSVDINAGEKRAARERSRQDSLQRAALSRQILTAQQRNDSLEQAKALSEARSKAVADSMAQAAALKARNDSLALANSNKLLQEERNKRSEMEKQLLTTGLLLLDAVYFETGKTEISINSEPYLSLIAKMLTKYPKLQIEIGGHTDNVGGLTYNQNLSQGRSQAVVDYMLRVAPDLQGRLTAKGYAYSQPKADNKTAAGRQLNRRTELKVINKDALGEYR